MMASDLAVTASRDGCRPGAIAAAMSGEWVGYFSHRAPASEGGGAAMIQERFGLKEGHARRLVRKCTEMRGGAAIATTPTARPRALWANKSCFKFAPPAQAAPACPTCRACTGVPREK